MTEHSPLLKLLPYATNDGWSRLCNEQNLIVAGMEKDLADIVLKRVNGWDALVQERDELRACVATLVDMLPSCDVRDGTHVPTGCYLCRARTLVRP